MDVPAWHRVRLAVSVLAAASALAVLLLLSPGGEAKVVIDHDLDVATSQTLADDTFEVHGNVTVRPGATLTLLRSTLVIVGSSNGTHMLDVHDGAVLVADNATIRGAPHTIGIHLPGGCSLSTTVVEHIESANASRGLWLRGGDTVMYRVTVRDCPNNTAVLVESNLTARDCSFSALGTRGVQLGATRWPIAARLDGCSFDGGLDPMEGAIGLHVAWNTSVAQRGTVTVTGCDFTSLPVGLYAQPNSTDVVLAISDLRFTNCVEGLVVTGNRADVTVADCAVEGFSADVGIGLYVPFSDYPAMVLTVDNLTVTGCERGVYVRGPSVGFTPRLPRLAVADCDYGVAVQGCTVEVVDSAVLDCSYCFEAEQRGHIDVRRTAHKHMSAAVAQGEEGAIVAYSTVNVTSCRWRGAFPISSGTLYLYGEDTLELERLDPAALAPVEVVVWARSRWNLIGRLLVIPTYYKDGERFEAANFSVYDTSAQQVEVVDNRTPELTDITLNAHEGLYINTTSLRVSGHLVEKGTGFDRLEASLEDVEDKVVYVDPDGNWTVSFGPLEDGVYNLTLRGSDMAGNRGWAHLDRIVIDTISPSIFLNSSWHRLWNSSFVIAEGWSSEGGMVRFGTQVLGVDWNGPDYRPPIFRLGDVFKDGAHIEALSFEDHAGNTNAIMLTFTVDTVVPSLTLTAPANGSWSASGLITVTGLAELNASLQAGGESVSRPPGEQAFSLALRLDEGDVTVVVRATDEAGNVAEASVLVRVDLTAPVITIDEPASDRVVTVEDTASLKAEVIDANLASVQLDGLEVPLLDGFLARTLQVADGTNVFRLVALDLAGNRAERNITILRDITPPTAQHSVECVGGRLVRVGEEEVATAPLLNLTITPSEWVRATIKGGLGLAEGEGPLLFELALSEGPNEFTVLVEDEAGLKGASIVVRVTLDTTPPAITVAEPLDGARVETSTVRVVGSVEPGSSLEVMGMMVTVAGDGSFNVQVSLVKGANHIILHATDRVGLESYLNLTVTRSEKEEDGPGPGAPAVVLSFVATGCALAAIRARQRR
jgi:hypothetical protein